MKPPHIVQVALEGRGYDIIIGRGVLADGARHLAPLVEGRRGLIVTDETVAKLHLAPLRVALDVAGCPATSLILPPGEATKSWAFLEKIVEHILLERLERGDFVIALGGGVMGDLAGFAAAIARRGMRFLQVPTSLLAQVDSAVGGKTGINSKKGKNLIGAFYQPALVLADTGVLDTLSAREFRAGYAEVVKYGLIDQPKVFEWLEAGAASRIFTGGAEREEAVEMACRAKAAIVARDETETGDRALLNLGHTFGHALEALTQYDSARLVHGEGVAIGMAMAHRFSVMLGLCPKADAARVETHLLAMGLPVHASAIAGFDADDAAMLAAMKQDKKVSRGSLTFILTRGIGQSFIAKDVPEEKVMAFLAQDRAFKLA